MNQRIIETFIIIIITSITIGCSNSDKKSSVSTNTPTNEMVDTVKMPSDEQASDDAETTPNTSTVQKCAVCNGGGVVTWYDGSQVSCPSCNGTGFVDLQQVMNDVKSDINNGTGGIPQSGRTSRSRDDIATDINKTTQLLNDNEATLARLKNNNESVTLWPRYEEMIRQSNDRLYNLNIEYNSATR